MKACARFTGAEIAALVADALFAAFADGAREIATADLIKAAGDVVPLSRTAANKITSLLMTTRRSLATLGFQRFGRSHLDRS